MFVLFEQDRSLFTEYFCVNKDRPQLKCNGQCALAKMLKEQENNDVRKFLSQLQYETICIEPATIITVEDLDRAWYTKSATYYQNFYDFIYLTALFHPPDTPA